jgi:hypothetical protein
MVDSRSNLRIAGCVYRIVDRPALCDLASTLYRTWGRDRDDDDGVCLCTYEARELVFRPRKKGVGSTYETMNANARTATTITASATHLPQSFQAE